MKNRDHRRDRTLITRANATRQPSDPLSLALRRRTRSPSGPRPPAPGPRPPAPGDGGAEACTGAAPITAGTKAIGSSANADMQVPISRRQVNSRLAFRPWRRATAERPMRHAQTSPPRSAASHPQTAHGGGVYSRCPTSKLTSTIMSTCSPWTRSPHRRETLISDFIPQSYRRSSAACNYP